MRIAFILVLSIVAGALVACGGGLSKTPSVQTDHSFTVTPTRTPPSLTPPSGLWGSVAYNEQDALSFARDVFLGKPPWTVQDEIQSVQYVETTAKRVQQLFGPPSTAQRDQAGSYVSGFAPGDLKVWVIVAQGKFQSWPMGIPSPEPANSAIWVVVPKDRQGMTSFPTDRKYDIERLGKATDVTLPLPEWPTPVSLARP